MLIAAVAVITAIVLVISAIAFYTPSSLPAASPINEEPSSPISNPIVSEPGEVQEPDDSPTGLERLISFLPILDDDDSDSLPECNKRLFTVTPVDLNEVYEISPLGNLGPPAHTLPTEHMYFHISAGGSSTKRIPLRAPGDIFILEVIEDKSRGDFSIRFALCDEVYGYYNHVKGLSSDLRSVLEAVECTVFTHSGGDSCSKSIFHKVDAGKVLGEVGDLQGNFDFGAFDFRTILDYANPSRYGEVGQTRSLHIVCPIELYDDETKRILYDKVARSGGQECGVVMQDLPGTLQGNWFHGDVKSYTDWTLHLAFVHDNEDPSKSVISIGGFFTNAGKWEFEAENSGLIDREFSDVRSDGNIYCYDLGQSGRLLVLMTSDTELRIESQSGICSGSVSFDEPSTYER